MASCQNCSVEIRQGEEITLRGQAKGAGTITLCHNCNFAMERALKAEVEDTNQVGALILGLGAAVGASLLWYAFVVLTKSQLGLIAIAVGWLVAQAVILGAGHKRGPRLQILSVGLTLVAMALSEYLIVRHFAVEALATEGYTNIPFLLPVNVMVSLVIEGIKNDPLSLLFWGIAVWEAYAIPAPRRLQRAQGTQVGAPNTPR